jgi:hypothetical protein
MFLPIAPMTHKVPFALGSLQDFGSLDCLDNRITDKTPLIAALRLNLARAQYLVDAIRSSTDAKCLFTTR